MIETNKTRIVYDKPVYVGCCILDISKIKMMDFHYNVIHKQFGEGGYNSIYSDTDSFVYEIFVNDVYDWMKEK